MTMLDDGITIPVAKTPDTPPAETPPTNTRVFTEEEVEAIRRQEKDKLYKSLEESKSRLKTMEEQMASIQAEKDRAIAEAQERAKAEAEELRKREIEEMSAKDLLLKREDEFNQRLNEVQEEWQTKFQRLEEEKAQREALLEKERAYQALEAYRQRRMNEEQDNIIPELLDLVSGSTPDEVELSIAALRDRSNAIMENVRQQASQTVRPKGAPVTAPPVGPLDNEEYQTLTAEQIAAMPMDQFASMRDRLLKVTPNQQRGRF